MSYQRFECMPKGRLNTQKSVDLKTQGSENGLIVICECNNEICSNPKNPNYFICSECGTTYMGPHLRI